MKYPFAMKCLWIVPLLMLVVGCGPSAPKVVAVSLPKDTVLIEPGPVDPDAPEEFTTTESGLKYRIRRKSDGKKPTDTSVVRCHYRGRLANGTIFDSSYGKTGRSAEFGINGVIKGWGEGLKLIGEGGMIEMEIPPELAYGGQTAGEIPPNSTLYFIVELLEVKD